MPPTPLRQRASMNTLSHRETGISLSSTVGAMNGAGGSATIDAASAAGAASGSGANATSVQVAVRIRPLTPHDQSAIPSRWQRSVVGPASSNAVHVDASGQAPPGSVHTPGSAKKHTFTFDHVMGPDDGQEQVYQKSVHPLVSRFLEGYNITVLAYGQTSSGKSYTMGTSVADVDFEGLVAGQQPDPQTGIIPRAVAQIFSEMKQMQAHNGNSVQLSAKASFIEIYNEELIDLLAADEGDSRPLVQIREDKSGHIFWAGLREVRVQNVAEVMNHLLQGSSARRTHETDMNAQSSRSHAIFSLTLTQRKYVGGSTSPQSPGGPPTAFNRSSMIASSGRTTPTGRSSGLPRPTSAAFSSGSRASGMGRPNTPGQAQRAASALGHNEDRNVAGGEWITITSKFHFVDLAGSERLKRTAAQGERVREGISINSGLHALGNVISALGDPAKSRRTTHIPYRDSKLTRLLQDSLGGNAFTCMIACVAPTEYNVSETVNTLQYANRARNIKNKAELNQVEVGWEDVDYLQTQVLKLRKELQILRGFKAGTVGSDAALRVMEQKDVLEWQSRYAVLSQRYTALTAQLTQLQQTSKDTSSNDDYYKAAEPIIIEYEKTVDALEGQINLMKAALGHSEDVILAHEQAAEDGEARIASLEDDLQAREQTMGQLQERLAKLEQRESATDGYARDLESRLVSRNSNGEADAQGMSELRKELTKLREADATREQYIKELESRLANSDENVAALQSRLSRAENDIERREEAYKELQERMELMDNSNDTKALLGELDERDRKLLDLETKLEGIHAEKDEVIRERGKLADAAALHQIERGKLEDHIRELKAASDTVAARANAPVGMNTVSSGLSVASHSTGAPSANPDEELAFLQTQVEMLTEELKAYQEASQQSQKDLQDINIKYKDALAEIRDLNQQVTENRLTAAPSPGAGPETVTSRQAPQLVRTSSQHSISGRGRPESLLLDNSPARRKSLSRRSSGSFLGYNPRESTPRDGLQLPTTPQAAIPTSRTSPSGPVTPGAEHTRRRSISQSSGPGWHSGGKRPLSLSGNADFAKLGLDTSSAGSAQFADLQSSLALDGKSPQTTSPEELTRRVASLEAETMRLQEVLRERDDEIIALERGKRDRHSASEANVVQNNVGGAPKEASGVEGRTADVDELMRSMARKETEVQREMEALRQDLNKALKEKDAAASIALNQQQNMAAELSILRQQLGSDGTDKESARDLNGDASVESRSTALMQKVVEHADALDELSFARNASMDQALDELRRQQQNDHDTAMRSLEADHRTTLESLKAEHATALSAAVSAAHAAHSKVLTEPDQETAQVLASREGNDHTLVALKEEHAIQMRDLAVQQDAAIEKLSKSHATELDALRSEHATTLQLVQRDLEAAGETHSKALDSYDVERSTSKRDIETLQQNHVHALEQLEALKSTHSEKLRSLAKEHSSRLGEMEKSLQDAIATREAIAATHDDLQGKYQGLLEQDPNEAMALRAELNETSDALVTLEGALTEAQDERDKLIHEIEELRQGSAVSTQSKALAQAQKEVEHLHASLANTRSELQRVKSDFQGMLEEKTRHESLMREMQIKLTIAETRSATSQRPRDGTPSSPSNFAAENGPSSDAVYHSTLSPSTPVPGRRESMDQDSHGRSRLGVSSAKPPPLSPPPNIPPPPTPSSNGATTPTQQQRNSYGMRSSASSSSLTHNRPDSPPINVSLSRSSSTTSMNTPSIHSIAASDSKTARLLSDQAEELKNLARQLNHCEQDLQANIDLVATLEAALNDSERNLRKSRVQLSEAARERDRYAAQTDELRQQVAQTQREADNVRNSVMLEKQGYESQLQHEREAKERARRALEARLEEVHKKKNSRLFCM